MMLLYLFYFRREKTRNNRKVDYSEATKNNRNKKQSSFYNDKVNIHKNNDNNILKSLIGVVLQVHLTSLDT